MYQISKSPKTGKYYVALFGKNHRMLSSSEANGLNSKKGAKKNIIAQMIILRYNSTLVQDNTDKVPGVFRLYTTGPAMYRTKVKMGKPYIPGKK